MRTALTDRDAANFRAAVLAGFACAVIGTKIILEFAAAIDPVDGCAVAADALFQHGADRVVQRFSLFCRDRTRCAQWMKFRDVQGFVGVDVAEPGEEPLIEQQRFELALFTLQCTVKPSRSEVFAKRFGSESAEDFGGVCHEPHAPELTRIVERQRLVAG